MGVRVNARNFLASIIWLLCSTILLCARCWRTCVDKRLATAQQHIHFMHGEAFLGGNALFSRVSRASPQDGTAKFMSFGTKPENRVITAQTTKAGACLFLQETYACADMAGGEMAVSSVAKKNLPLTFHANTIYYFFSASPTIAF